MTARIFVQLQAHWTLSNLPSSATPIAVTYLDQVIPSPYGMAAYESTPGEPVTPKEFAIEYYDKEQFVPVLGSDASGDRVKAFVDLVFTAEEYQCQERFLSRPNKEYSFIPSKVVEAIEISGVAEILAANRLRHGLYRQAHQFQRCSVEKWKGQQSPLQLLALDRYQWMTKRERWSVATSS